MPTPDDLVAIDSFRRLAADIRGAGQASAEGQIAASGIAENRRATLQKQEFESQQAEVARNAALDRLKLQLKEGAEDRIAGRKFTSEESRKSDKRRAKENEKDRNLSRELKGVEGVDDQEVTEAISRHGENKINDAVDSGFLEVGEDEEGNLVPAGVSGRADKQGDLLRRSIISGSNVKSRVFTNPKFREANNSDVQELLTRLRKQGVKESDGQMKVAKLLQIPKGMTKATWLKRLNGFRDSMIRNEITNRITEAQKDPEFGQTFPSVAAPGVVKGGITKESIKQSKDNIRFGVIREFGGPIDLNNFEADE